MNDRHVLNELSAYLDGEASCPERVARHLETCGASARRLEELRTLSRRLKELPEPEVNPAFQTRVLARAAEGSPARAATNGRLWAAAAGPVVTLALAVAVAAVVFHQGPDALRVARQDVRETPDDTAPWTESGALDDDPLAAGTYDDDAIGEGDSVEEADLIEELAETGWFLMVAADWDAGEDVDVLIDALSPTEAEQFRQLLQEYKEEVI